MRKKFSTKWISSKKPNKQRKYVYNAPLHIRQKFVHAHLSKELREKYGYRAVRVRLGDKVRVMRGNFKGKSGKVAKVDLKRRIIFIEGIEREKIAGDKSKVPIHPSNVVIEELNLDDKKRKEKLELKLNQEKNKKNQKKEENGKNNRKDQNKE